MHVIIKNSSVMSLLACNACFLFEHYSPLAINNKVNFIVCEYEIKHIPVKIQNYKISEVVSLL